MGLRFSEIPSPVQDTGSACIRVIRVYHHYINMIYSLERQFEKHLATHSHRDRVTDVSEAKGRKRMNGPNSEWLTSQIFNIPSGAKIKLY